ncbi:apoptosis facilitator Bcl-2-like protein 14 isoform X1 [Crotalus tigris]|uniref:apoptosis facilitator Bcl-2-like protein 14 isoform X1 n=1 Tax=Crotalus tigris TaxID=88082 RepID=UPI00192F7E81|nr:apoptosis facilitator Bcl-2-like protein 14 isoform X1 [Crotalus tigris]
MEGPDRSCKMNNECKNGLDNMEEIPLEDTDRTSVEFRLLMVYAQRRLSASKYGQLLEREPRVQEEMREVVQVNTLTKEEEVTFPEISPEDHKPPNQKDQKKMKKKKKKAKKTKTRTSWRCFCIPSCLRPQAKDTRNQRVARKQDSINGHAMKPVSRLGGLSGGQNDSDIPRLAERLVEIVDRSRFPGGKKSTVVVERALSLEEDGGSASKPIPPAGDDGLDNEEKVIDAIVALLRKSGDELEEKTKKDKIFRQCIRDMMTYTFFRRVTDQFLEEIPIDSTARSEDELKSVKVALIMEATTRLTAIDNHPMNLVLGFGTKYLQENFSPWVQSQGGWVKALGLPEQEEVE